MPSRVADADTATAQNWISLFPALKQLETETVQHLARTAQVVDLPAGQQVFHTGDACQKALSDKSRLICKTHNQRVSGRK